MVYEHFFLETFGASVLQYTKIFVHVRSHRLSLLAHYSCHILCPIFRSGVCGGGAYAGAGRRRVHLATIVLRSPSGHRPGRTPGPSCPYPSDRPQSDATKKYVNLLPGLRVWTYQKKRPVLVHPCQKAERRRTSEKYTFSVFSMRLHHTVELLFRRDFE